MRFVIPLVLVAVVVGVVWVVAPRYLSSDTGTRGNGQISYAAPDGEAMQAKLDESEKGDIRGVQAAHAAALVLAYQENGTFVADQYRSANDIGARETSAQVPLPTEERPRSSGNTAHALSLREDRVREAQDAIDARIKRLESKAAQLQKSVMNRNRPAHPPIPNTQAASPVGVSSNAATQPQAATAPQRAFSWRPVLGCVIEPDQTAEIGSPVVGVVSSIEIERGDRVERDQVLARLRSNVERASVEVAQARTQADAEVRAAQTNVKFLRQKLARAEELVAMNFVSKQALEQARADAHLAEERLAQAREQQQIWQRELNLANAQLQMRTIRAPFDGVIVDRYVSVSERIEDQPLFRIVKTDPLRVELVAPSTMFGTVSTGTVVTVIPELPNAPALLAQVVLVDTVIDGASNTFRVRATLPNPDGELPSGLRCRAELSDLPVMAAGALPAVSGKERASGEVRMVFKIDTSLASLQRGNIAGALRGKPKAAQNQ